VAVFLAAGLVLCFLPLDLLTGVDLVIEALTFVGRAALALVFLAFNLEDLVLERGLPGLATGFTSFPSEGLMVIPGLPARGAGFSALLVTLSGTNL